MSEILFSVKLSLFIACISTVIVACMGTFLGYLLARSKFPLREFVDALCVLPLVLPPTVLGFFLLELLGKQSFLGQILNNWFAWTPIFTWQAAVLASVLVSMPLMVKTSKAAFQSVDPNLELVSLTLGKSPVETFFKVSVPLAGKGLVAGLALSFTRAIGEFGATLMVAGNIPGKTQTIPLLIYQATQTGENSLVYFLVVLLSLFCLAVVLLSNRLGGRW